MEPSKRHQSKINHCFILVIISNALKLMSRKTVKKLPLTKVYLLSFQTMLPTLENANVFFQRDEPFIHVLKSHLTHL